MEKPLPLGGKGSGKSNELFSKQQEYYVKPCQRVETLPHSCLEKSPFPKNV